MSTGLTPASTTTINDLPECLLLHIFSFLPPIDAIINTSPVSSKWRHLWIMIPTLDLSIDSFASGCSLSMPHSEIRQLFAEFISWFLFIRHRNSSSLHKFQLSFDYKDYDCHKDYVDAWIGYVIDLNCKVLFINLKDDSYCYAHGWISEDDEDEEDYDYDKFCIYLFDFSSLLNSSVEVLKLKSCNFCFPSASISSLKSLYLENYDFFMDDSNVSELVPLCVNLEILSIQGSGGWRSLKIASLSLKELILAFHRVPEAATSCVEICAPNLCKVTFSHFFVGKCILRDVKSLVEANVLDFFCGSAWSFACWSNVIVPLADVERLTVQNMWIWYKFDQIEDQSMSDDELDNKSEPESDVDPDVLMSGKVPVSEAIFSNDFAFNNLKYLRLLTGYGIRDVLGLELCLEMCPKLETLVLENEYKSGDEDGMIEMSTSRPIIFQMKNLKEVKL